MSGSWPPLFIARDSHQRGVAPPGTPADSCAETKCVSHTYDWRQSPRSEANTHAIEPVYRPIRAPEMIHAKYRTEAHVVAYEVFDRETGEGIGAQPRVRKIALPWLREQGYDVRLGWLMADVDTPGHVSWTPETRAIFDELWARAPKVLSTCAVYLSPKGYRIMQPIEPLAVEVGERALYGWLERLVEAGVWENVREVRDWTRHMRVPNHLRDGAMIVSPWQDWTRCRVIAPPIPAALPERVSIRRGNPARPRSVEQFDDECPEGWTTVADAVGSAIRDHVTSDWRRCYLAIAGALLELGCPPEKVPAVVARAHSVDPEWSYLLADRVQIARDTVLRWGTGADVSRAQHLRRGWPRVADALDDATTSGFEASVLRQLRSVERRTVDVSDATSILRQEIRDAYGITLLAGPPGLGKTEAVLAHAKGLPPIQGRAKAGQRIALSAPTTRLAKEVQDRAEAQGVRTLRVFGSISHRAEDGAYTCIHRDRALPLVEGGQSLERLFCAPEGQPECEMAKDCPARPGSAGSAEANLILGPHELLGKMARHVGASGTIVVDEPPPLVETTSFALEALGTSLQHLDAFRADYGRRMAGVLHAILAWVANAEPGDVADGPGAVRLGCEHVPLEHLPPGAPDDLDQRAAALLYLAQTAIGEGARTIAPPLTLSAASHARRSVARAVEIGDASRALLGVYRALQPPIDGLHPTRIRVTAREGKRIESFVGANETAVDVLRRDAATVLLDAGAALLAPSVERIAGHRPRLVELDVADGAPVTRTILVSGGATRRGLVPRSGVDVDTLAPMLRAAFLWALEDERTDSLVFVSWAAIEAIVASILGDPGAPGMLRASGVPAKVAHATAERVGDVVRRWVKPVRTAHFFGLRGLDAFKEFDALITLGDPRSSLDVEADRCAWLGLDLVGQVDALAAAELDQAHGRLRLVHREKPARALHVGAIVPAGWRGREIEVRRMPVGRPKTVASEILTPEGMLARRGELELSLRALSLRTGISPSTLCKYETGSANMSDDTARRIAAALAF